MTISEPLIEKHLGAIASRAAFELDGLTRHETGELHALPRLIQFLSDSLTQEDSEEPGTLPIDATAAVVLSRAIGDSNWTTPPTRVSEIQAIASDIITRLIDVMERAQAGETLDPESVCRMRSFALSLSRRIYAMSPAWEDMRAEHPWRRLG